MSELISLQQTITWKKVKSLGTLAQNPVKIHPKYGKPPRLSSKNI